MTTFEELVGAEPTGAERERLQSVHELLLEAGPPPELTPEIEAGPTLGMTLGRIRRLTDSRRRFYIPAVAAAVFIAALIGFSLSSPSTGLVAIPLTGTAAAPHAAGTLALLTPTATSQPMVVNVQGLKPGTYAVYLSRAGRSWEKCGTFLVKNLASGRRTTIDSPYRAKRGDTWVVTRLTAAGRGATVLQPANA